MKVFSTDTVGGFIVTDNPEEQAFPDEPGSQEAETTESKGQLVAAFGVVAIILLGILAYAVLSSSSYFSKANAFITITEPVQAAVLDITMPVTVKGQGGGLSEGNVIILALDNTGDVLAKQPTTINPGKGDEGTWSVDLLIDSMPGTQGKIVAYSTLSAEDSTIASDSIAVTFGGKIPEGEMVNLEEHLWILVALNGEPLIENTLITLNFEDFRAFGFAGCNRYITNYARRRSNLNFDLVTSTAKSCEFPIGVMPQDEKYFTALEQAAAFVITNQQLKVFNNSNDLLLVYDSVVMGSVTALDATGLQEGALVNLKLSDVSLADIESEPIAEQVITGASEFPISFTVNYDPLAIKKKNSYAIEVRIEDRSGNLIFINTTAYPVITGGNPSVLDVSIEAIQ